MLTGKTESTVSGIFLHEKPLTDNEYIRRALKNSNDLYSVQMKPFLSPKDFN